MTDIAIITDTPPPPPPRRPVEASIVSASPTDNDLQYAQQVSEAEIASAKNHPEWYFNGSHLLFRILRFLNMLEPDRTVVSMTKIMLWAATIQSMLVISTSTSALTVAGSLGLNVATMFKHEARRKTSGIGD